MPDAIEPDWVVKKVKRLHELIADEVEIDEDEESILSKVFDEDDLEDILENFPVLHGALVRVADDYEKALESDANLMQSQQSLSAVAENMVLRADADAPDDDKDAAAKKRAPRE